MRDAMNIYLMTDMEGCAGMLNHDDWVLPTSRYYEKGRQILTEETNATVSGFFDSGATRILVVDGHGAGGIDPLLLDPRAELLRGWPDCIYPLGLDTTFDAVAWVGQHAKAGTDYSHITHTGWFNCIDDSVNGLSIGEYGAVALCARELGIPSIFAGGEAALAAEVEALAPGTVTVAVKRGIKKDGLEHLTTDEYRAAKLSAIHLSHAEACRLLRAGAAQALQRLKTHPDSFRYVSLQPPYVRTIRLRADAKQPAHIDRHEHPDSLIGLMNAPYRNR
jgi:D-amino peptidase